MRLSLAFEMQRPVVDDHAVIKETLQQCVRADEMGFDTVWFVEHHFLTSFSMSPAPEVIFGALSRLTRRIRLGFGVVILPHHHPVRVAERVAMIDHMSGGRVEFGNGTLSALRADRDGDRSAQHSRHVGRIAAHDPPDLGGRPVLCGWAVLDIPAA
jgi:alkanesulfonate monooxygenase SsuD/methylene tetrahydromethanopterin reductase-like flavin-dependent oxidoreductase (luciferase family)